MALLIVFCFEKDESSFNEMKMSELELSIIVCTYNRCDLARNAIASVLEQGFPSEKYELIIVDNASSDNTPQMAQSFCEAYPHVRYFLETKVGLSHARNRGLKEAQGEYVGYLDDDALASSGWLSAAYKVATDIHPEAFGGPYYAFYNSPKPAWFKDEYGSYTLGDQPRKLTKDEYFIGNNMFILRDLLLQMGGFDPELGMRGDKIAYAEETQIFMRLHNEYEFAILYYDPAVFIYHLVRSNKFGIWNIVQTYFGVGRDSYCIQKSNENVITATMLDTTRVFKWVAIGIFSTIYRDRKKYSRFMNYFYEELRVIPAILGRIYARWFLSKFRKES